MALHSLPAARDSGFHRGTEMASDLSAAITAQMVDSVREAKAEREPFPHAIISNFFPPKVYDDLLSFLPKNEQYQPFSYGKHHSDNGSSNRLRFRMQNEWLDRLSGAQRTFWYAVRQALGSQQLKRAVYDKMKVGLAFRFGVEETAVNNVAGYALPELFRELSSYRIKPHPDTRRKVVTMQISLPRNHSQRDLGTEFYKRSLNPVHMMREPRGFEIVKVTPYLPNSAYCFSVLNNLSWKSWHGRSTLPANCGVRNTILNIWYQDAEDANLDLHRAPARVAA
jgi:hypothetical protein